MKIGVLSDSHDNIWRLEEAIPHLQQCSVVLHCGDLISPFMVKRIREGLGTTPVHMVWGNNDGDKRLLAEVASNLGNFYIHGELAELEIGGLRIAMNHYPEISRALAESGRYDLVCFGHNHIASVERINNTVLLNPGEMMGLNGRSTVVIFDSESRDPQFVDLPGS